MKRYVCLGLLLLCGCAGPQAASSPPANNAVTLAWQDEYLGFGTDACVSGCVRGPAYNTAVPVSQPGNASTFSVTSSNASVATGTIVMTGPSAQSDPAVEVVPHKAGTAILTVSGINGSSAHLPVNVTTISTMTVTLNGFPTAATLIFTVSAPASDHCPSFEGGYSFQWDVAAAPATQTVLHNFPAMGSGPLSGCLFSTVTVDVRDASYTSLATKTVSLPISLGQDNPSRITIP